MLLLHEYYTLSWYTSTHTHTSLIVTTYNYIEVKTLEGSIRFGAYVLQHHHCEIVVKLLVCKKHRSN